MGRSSDSELLVLHGLRLKSVAPVDLLAGLVGLPTVVVADLLVGFEAKKWVRHHEGVLVGWALLPDGRAEEKIRMAHELDEAGLELRSAIDVAYRKFLDLNPAMLQVCTDWQLRPVVFEPQGDAAASDAAATDANDNAEIAAVLVANDHSDAAYDRMVVGVLKALNTDVQPIVASLAAIFDRFAGYGLRLSTALLNVEIGKIDWFDKPIIDSCHTVWFELHEDLLSTLGIERGQEVAN